MPDEASTTSGPSTGDGPRSGENGFWGSHAHALDPKGRVILPARFREPFRDGGFLTKLPEGGLGLWTPREHARRTAAMLDNGRQGAPQRVVTRVWAAGAFEVVPDNQGRVVVPPKLRSFAGLTGDIVVNGAINHVEIWDASTWDEMDASGSDDFRSGVGNLDEIGF